METIGRVPVSLSQLVECHYQSETEEADHSTGSVWSALLRGLGLCKRNVNFNI